MSILRQGADVVGTAVPPRLRVVIAEPGPDGHDHDHDHGAGMVARALGDAGHEVSRPGPRPAPQHVLATADVLGADRGDVQEPTC
ncbi:hypothetical protein AB0J21_08900 [Streptomyces sp. NPDC049954]|uniref:hypothetical protein n=1 Tax=Streptomyces sp. NPDC049954 TaxID=3155779 RepID=UPI00344AB01E